jgi:hypothetical protein
MRRSGRSSAEIHSPWRNPSFLFPGLEHFGYMPQRSKDAPNESEKQSLDISFTSQLCVGGWKISFVIKDAMIQVRT